MGAQDMAVRLLAREFHGVSDDEIVPRAHALVTSALERAGYELVRRGQTDVGQSVFIMVAEFEKWFQEIGFRVSSNEV